MQQDTARSNLDGLSTKVRLENAECQVGRGEAEPPLAHAPRVLPFGIAMLGSGRSAV